MTYKEVIYGIREGINALSIESDFTDRYILFLINQFRATVVRQHLTNNPGEYRNQLTQTLFLELELVDNSRFPELLNTNYTILATTKVLPNIIGQQMYKEIEVRTISRLGEEIEMSHKERLIHFQYAPEGFIFGYRDNDGKIYLISKNILHKSLSQITVEAIFESPELVSSINGMEAELETYPITFGLWTVVKDMVIQQLAREMATPTDTVTDNADNTINTGNGKNSQE